jgi:hypothetical protein
MLTDRFAKTCLAMMVLLLGILTYNQSVRTASAASPLEYMIESNSGQTATVLNSHMKKRVSEGWTLHTFGLNYLVWQK